MPGSIDVSIVIAVCNGGKYLAATLDSLRAQTYENWECWIVDDGSTDSTVSIVEAYSQTDSRFGIIKTGGGNGPYQSANLAISRCKGSLIARIDADDIALPERLEIQRRVFHERPNVNVCASYYYYLHGDGRLTIKEFDIDPVFLRWQLLFRNRLVHSTMMFRKSWFIQIGMYPKKRLAQDWFVWVESVRFNSLFVIPMPLIQWRMHETSITKTEKGSQLIHAAEVSQHAVSSILGINANLAYLHTIILALHGKEADNSALVWKSLEQLVEIWQAYKRTQSISPTALRRLRDEFIYFGFFLLTVNHRILKNWPSAIVVLCRTETSLTTFKWLLTFVKRKIMYSIS